MVEEITRRAVLGFFPAFLLNAAIPERQKGQILPQAGEFVRFADPTTETSVVRLTSPAYANVLPSPTNRFVSLKPRFLLCSSDRNGPMAPFQIDLRTGAMRQICETAKLDPVSLCLDAQGRSVYFLDGGSLQEIVLGGKHGAKTMTEDISAFAIGQSPSELFTIRRGQLEQAGPNGTTVLAEQADGPCVVRPGEGGCLFARRPSGPERELWYAPVASPRKPGCVARGLVSNPCWSADGQSVLFLRQTPVNDVLISEVREVRPEEGKERAVSKTSQFAVFSPNGNDSVFVGASGSKAQPNIILLLSSTQRELTLCEHRSSNAADVRPVFSPDSRRVYFQSDREGKLAIYSVNVELLVEPV